MSCQFCGSEQIKIETPFVEIKDSGEYGAKKTYCCRSQEANAKYLKKHYNPLDPNTPELEEVGDL